MPQPPTQKKLGRKKQDQSQQPPHAEKPADRSRGHSDDKPDNYRAHHPGFPGNRGHRKAR